MQECNDIHFLRYYKDFSEKVLHLFYACLESNHIFQEAVVSRENFHKNLKCKSS